MNLPTNIILRQLTKINENIHKNIHVKDYSGFIHIHLKLDKNKCDDEYIQNTLVSV